MIEKYFAPNLLNVDDGFKFHTFEMAQIHHKRSIHWLFSSIRQLHTLVAACIHVWIVCECV